MAKILIVEDDFAIRSSVEFALRRAGFEVKTLDSGIGASEFVASFQPDLILLDLMLPGASGFEIAQALREKDTETAIIMMTALGDDADKLAGFAVGADDYVTKPFSVDVLLARVKANLKRVRSKELLKNLPIKVGDLVIDPRSFRITVAGKVVPLRNKEFQLLFTLAQNEGQLCTREELAENVWGYEHLASSRTIDVHIRRLRSEIEAMSAYTYIQTVHGMGYRFLPCEKE